MSPRKKNKKSASTKKDSNTSQDRHRKQEEKELRQKLKLEEKFIQLFNDLEAIEGKLKLVEHNDLFKEWLSKFDGEDDTRLSGYQDILARVSMMMNQKRSNTVGQYKDKIMKLLGAHFVCRVDGRTLAILQPMQVFESSPTIDNFGNSIPAKTINNKTFAFVREKGGWPLKFAISGPETCIKDLEVLDSELWTDLSMRFMKNNGETPRSSRYENTKKRQVPSGLDISSHVERKLMLYFCTKKYLEHKKDEDLEVIVLQKLVRLQEYYPHGLTAEIKINRIPCKECNKFRKLVQLHSGFKFEWVHMPTLGECELGADAHGNVGFEKKPREQLVFSDESESEPDESPSSRLSLSRTTIRKIAVEVTPAPPVISQALERMIDLTDSPPPSPIKAMTIRRKGREPRQTSILEETTTTTLKETVWKYAYRDAKVPASSRRALQATVDDNESEDGEYIDGKASRKISKLITPPGSRHKPGKRASDGGLFPPGAHEIAQNINDAKYGKRKRDPSPSAPKHKSKRV